jgi:hypothetical protein
MEVRVGRFAELRFGHLFNISETPRLKTSLANIFRDQPGKIVFCVDVRKIERFGVEEEKQMIAVMNTDNPRIERTAILINENGRFGLQILRMLQEADNRARRICRSYDEVKAWLNPVLTAAESARLEEFLNEED